MDSSGNVASTGKGLTLRSVLFGLLGVFLMSGASVYHDMIKTAGPMAIGNHLPGAALTYVIFLGLVWNGLAGRLWRRLALCPKELAVVTCATLVACFPPVSGLGRYFHRIIVLPWYYLPGNPDWALHGVLDLLKPGLFPRPLPYWDNGTLVMDEEVYRGFFTGLSQGNNWTPLWNLPLKGWLPALAYWGPLVFLMALCCVALQFVVHRQWAHHEQLGYPLAQVTGSLCYRADGRPGVPDLFRNRLFWWGAVPVFLLYLLQFLGVKYPSDFPSMTEIFPSLQYWFLPVDRKFPILTNSVSFWGLQGQSLLFVIVGAAYFVSTEISLTMGLSGFLIIAVGVLYYLTTGTQTSETMFGSQRGGSYVGYTIILLYTGRTYFRAVFAKALGFRKANVGGDDGSAVVAARVLLLAYAGLLAVLCLMGMEFSVAFFFSLLSLILFFVFTRIICETGIPFLQATWTPSTLLTQLFGPAAIGPRSLVLMNWTQVSLTQDPRECLMPYVATGVKLGDDNGLRLRRLFWIIVAAVALALVVGFLSNSYTQYNLSGMTEGWASYWPVVGAFGDSTRYLGEMKIMGEYGPASAAGTFFAKLGLVQTSEADLRFFLAGLAAVLVCASLRFKFSRFPIHPVMFMVWGTYPALQSWGSFLIGWFVKSLIIRIGGGGAYRRMKPLFLGLIAGEILAVGIHIVYNIAYMALFGTASPAGIGIQPS